MEQRMDLTMDAGRNQGKRCKYCDAPLGVLKRLSGGGFCSPYHEEMARQRRVSKVASLLAETDVRRASGRLAESRPIECSINVPQLQGQPAGTGKFIL
jgi:hypothetical protein